MSDFASVVERTRRAFASVSKLEGALTRDPNSTIVQVNLAAAKKLALKSRDELLKIAEYQRFEVCNYRLMPVERPVYALGPVSRSFLEYQDFFTQVYDARKNGPKSRVGAGLEAKEASRLEFAYSYSGSLGVVLYAPSDRDFFSGSLDAAIDTVFEALEINSRTSVRHIAKELGNAVVKRVHDWSKANIDGGFSADVIWKRSDGRQVGRVVERDAMEEIVSYIEATSDETVEEIVARGVLIGGDLKSGTFHFVEPEGGDFRGGLAEGFSSETPMTLGKQYIARIRQTSTTVYATEETKRVLELLSLSRPEEPLQAPLPSKG